MFELGEAVKVHLDLHAAAGPVLAHLREQTGESSQVGVLDGRRGRLRRPARERATPCGCSPRPAGGVPAHCTSSAARCCWRTASEPDARGASSPPRPLTRLTPHTITDPDALRAGAGHRARPRLGRGRRRAGDRGRLPGRARSATGTAPWSPPSASGRPSTGSGPCPAAPGPRAGRGRRGRVPAVWAGRRGRHVVAEGELSARHRRGREGAGALRSPPHPRADPAVHRRRARPRHGRRLRDPAGAGAAAARRRRPGGRAQGRRHVRGRCRR